MDKKNVLIFPGGTEVGLEINKSLRYCKEVEIFSVSSQQVNHAPFFYENHSYIPEVSDKDWIEQLNNIIEKYKIDLIFPANSIVIDALNVNREKIDCDILINNKKSLDITRSKKKTYSLLKNTIHCPDVYEVISSDLNFPIFAKPNNLYGSKGVHKINSFNEFQSIEGRLKDNDYIFTEYLPGEEYSIDCFTDKYGALRFSQARTRERIRMGTSMHSKIVSGALNDKLNNIAEEINRKLSLQGAWFFQMKKDNNNRLKLLEVELRIAGTMALNRVYGCNFALLSIFDFYNVDIPFLLTNDYEVNIDRALVNRYDSNIVYNHVYIDLDDTIVINGKINTDMVKFLYQCLNKDIKIHLISKSLAKDKIGFLRERRILQLFDELIWLKEEDDKFKYISENKAIFIDDSFSQRMDVSNRLGIHTFDPSMLEILIDDRI